MPSESLSRRLVIGLGRYGGLVVERIRKQLPQTDAGPDQRTRVLSFQPGVSPFEQFDGLSRKGTRRKFVESQAFVEVFQQIEEAVTFCARMPQACGDMVEADARIYLFLVADLADPFAGGLLLDMARLARVATLGRPSSIIAVLGLGLFLSDSAGKTYLERRPEYRNVCAAMREVEYVLREGLGGEFQYPDPIPAGPSAAALDQCFVLAEANQQGTLGSLQQHTHFTARFLFGLCRGEFLRLVDAFPKQAQSSAQTPKQPLYSSVGIASAFLPVLDIHAYCMERWANDVARALSVVQPAQATEVMAACEQVHSALPGSVVALADELGRNSAPLPDTSVPGGWPRSCRQAAEIFQTIIDQLEQATGQAALPPELEDFVESRYLGPFRTTCRCQVDRLVESSTAGIGLADAFLRRLYASDCSNDPEQSEVDLSAMLTASNRVVAMEQHQAKTRIAKCRQRLRQVLADPAERPLPPRPFWLRHPFQYWQVIRRERQQKTWLRGWGQELETLRQGLRRKQTAIHAHQAILALTKVVEMQRQEIRELIDKLQQAAAATGSTYRAAVPTPLAVDRSLLSRDCYETIYADCISEAGLTDANDALTWLVVNDRFLAGFRRSTAEQLATAMETAGRRFFDRVKTLDVDSVLRDPRFARSIPSPDDLVAGLWHQAEPLVDTSGALLPKSWNVGELSAIWLFSPNGSQFLTAPLAAASHYPRVNPGPPTSIHLARVIHGFTLDTLALLRVYVRSYNSTESKEELHILDWIDRLPPLPEAE